MMASYIIKTTFSMMAEVLSDEQVDQLRSMFNGIDEDGQGMIELEDAVEQIKSMIKDNPEAADLMKVICTGGITGRVNYLMYMATMTDRRRQLRREAARAVFNHFDIDKNGNVSLYEVAQALLKDDGIRISKVTQVSLKEIEKIWQEMRDVFVVHKGQQLSDREMSFDEFFKQLPSSSLDIGF
jgi:Ca2+-binding EF-hand superfamily protein